MAGKHVAHSEEWWIAYAPPTVVRCQARHKQGDKGQCRREAEPGTHICRQHGAAAQQVQAAAADAIRSAVEKAANSLQELPFGPEVDEGVRLKVVQDLIDR